MINNMHDNSFVLTYQKRDLFNSFFMGDLTCVGLKCWRRLGAKS